MSTIDYYNKNAEKYFDSTVNADMSLQRDTFLKYMNGSKILDFGCGSGRDSKYFKELGYEVDAIDGSKELTSLASKLTGLDVKNITFEEFDTVDYYDGVWACASLLHIPRKDLLDILTRIRNSLKEKGIAYISMKNGLDEEIDSKGRYYNYVTYQSFEEYMSKIGMEIIYYEKTISVSNPNETKYWNNFIVKKLTR